jgi:hypothetical protein
VLNGLRDILLGNEALIDEFAAEFKRELTRLRKEGQGANRRLLKELQQVERGIKRCLDFITGGDGDPGSVRDQLRRLEERKREIEIDLKALQGDVEIATILICRTPTGEKLPGFRKRWRKRRHALRLLKLSGHSLIELKSTLAKSEATARSLSSVHWLKSLHLRNKKRPPPHRETAVRS